MKSQMKLILVFSFMLIALTGCGSKEKEKVNDESALSSIRNAINKVYEQGDTLTTNNVQKYMVGHWIIVEAPMDTIRQSIPKELDKSTADEEWKTMFITACNIKTDICKDLKILKNEEGKLYVGSEAGAYGAKK